VTSRSISPRAATCSSRRAEPEGAISAAEVGISRREGRWVWSLCKWESMMMSARAACRGGVWPRTRRRWPTRAVRTGSNRKVVPLSCPVIALCPHHVTVPLTVYLPPAVRAPRQSRAAVRPRLRRTVCACRRHHRSPSRAPTCQCSAYSTPSGRSINALDLLGNEMRRSSDHHRDTPPPPGPIQAESPVAVKPAYAPGAGGIPRTEKPPSHSMTTPVVAAAFVREASWT
jgi:hypothetical protein